ACTLAFLIIRTYNQATDKSGFTFSNESNVTNKVRKSLRQFCLGVIAVTMISQLICAQTRDREWEWQNPLPQGNAISAIRFASDKLHGWAVGADGVILYTADGGFRWENQPTRLVNSLN